MKLNQLSVHGLGNVSTAMGAGGRPPKPPQLPAPANNSLIDADDDDVYDNEP
jgi:hypothetical protein